MRWTNKQNLPDPFVRLAMNDPYSKGNSDYTATGLDRPPRAHALLERFADDVVVDVSTRVDAIFGKAVHATAEGAARPGTDICEERFYGEVEALGRKYIISSQIDLFETDTGTLWDWKTAKQKAFLKRYGGGKKESWIWQLNVAAYLLRLRELNPKSLKILAIIKNWEKPSYGDSSGATTQVVEVDLPMLSDETTLNYITQRVESIVKAKDSVEIPLCTAKESWNGRRCADWCDASSVCDQYKQSLKTGVIEV